MKKQKKEESMNRETWLRAAYAILRKELLPEAPENVAISWSFPSKGATSQKKRRIGECWSKNGIGGKVEGDKVILVSPTIQKELALLDTLLHEAVHAALPATVGHRAAFSQLAKRVGLMKPWTATRPSPELIVKLENIIERLPKWPGGHLVPTTSQVSRQLKAECGCGRILRMSKKVAEGGPVICGLCDGVFELETE